MANDALGAWIRESRKARNWNQTQVGEMLGVSQVRVSQWETGKNAPDAEELRQLEVAFREKAPAPTLPAADGGQPEGGERTAERRQRIAVHEPELRGLNIPALHESPAEVAPGAHIQLRDAIWRVERVDLTSSGTQAWRVRRETLGGKRA